MEEQGRFSKLEVGEARRGREELVDAPEEDRGVEYYVGLARRCRSHTARLSSSARPGAG